MLGLSGVKGATLAAIMLIASGAAGINGKAACFAPPETFQPAGQFRGLLEEGFDGEAAGGPSDNRTNEAAGGFDGMIEEDGAALSGYGPAIDDPARSTVQSNAPFPLVIGHKAEPGAGMLRSEE